MEKFKDFLKRVKEVSYEILFNTLCWCIIVLIALVLFTIHCLIIDDGPTSGWFGLIYLFLSYLLVFYKLMTWSKK